MDPKKEALYHLQTIADLATYAVHMFQGHADNMRVVPSLLEELVIRVPLAMALIKEQIGLADAVAEDDKRLAEEDRAARQDGPARRAAGVRQGGLERRWPRHEEHVGYEPEPDPTQYTGGAGRRTITLPPPASRVEAKPAFEREIVVDTKTRKARQAGEDPGPE